LRLPENFRLPDSDYETARVYRHTGRFFFGVQSSQWNWEL